MKKQTLSIFLACLILIAGCDTEAQKSDSKTVASHTEEASIVGHSKSAHQANTGSLIETPNFDIQAEDYGKQVRPLLDNSEFATMTQVEVVDGDPSDAFIIDYPHHISLVGKVSESGKLESLVYTMPVNEQLEKSGANLSQLVTASMQVLNPELSESAAKSKVASLLDQAFSNYIMEKSQQRSVGVVKDKVYVCDISDKGVRVLIEPSEGSRYG